MDDRNHTPSHETGEPDAPSPTEVALAKLWASIVDTTVSAHDQFIDFTDSISAMEYVNRLRDEFQIEVPVTALYDKLSTIAKLAEMIDDRAEAAVKFPASEARPASTPIPEIQRLENPHAVPLPGGEWRVWKAAALRGAGFPASLVAELASERAARAADSYLHARRAAIDARVQALREVGGAIRQSEPGRRSTLRAVRRHLKQDWIRSEGALPNEKIFADALTRRERAYADYAREYDAAAAGLVTRLDEMLGDKRFREAVVWQNRRAIQTVTRKLRDAGISAGDRRNAAGFVAMLAQRYAVKNDSVGFFGPVGWAALTAADGVVESAYGDDLVSRRQVYFEGWAIDALADHFNADPVLRPWLSPRPMAGIWCSDDGVFAPIIGKVPLSDADRAVFELCDGVRTATRIAARLAEEDSGVTEVDIFAALDRLVRLKVISWRLEVAPQLFPERELAAKVARIGDDTIRARIEVELQTIGEARDRVSAAAGDADRLDAALANLESAFEAITGRSASRRAGQMYAGRGIVFEDCRRDCKVTLGAAFLRRLGPPLSLVLDAARWVSATLRRRFSAHLRACHAQLSATLGAQAIDAHLFLNHVGATAREALAPISAQVRAEYQARWQAILAEHAGLRETHVATDDVRGQVRATFAVDDASSWGGYFTPDILIATESPTAFEAGRFTCVLGELHSNNTLLWSALTSQHDRPEMLSEALEHDTGDRPTVVMQASRERWLSRLNPMVLPSFLRYEYGDGLPSLAPCTSVPAARLVVIDDGERIRACARDRGLSFDAYELFSVTMSYEADRIVSALMVPSEHTPRVTIGDLTIVREQWYLNVGKMPFLDERDPCVRFWQVRQWAAGHGMPRHVFYKSPGETKPCYMDLDSPVFVDAFVKLMRRLRRDRSVRITEMWPAADQTWLEDRQGRRYTSEIRIVARIGSPASPGQRSRSSCM